MEDTIWNALLLCVHLGGFILLDSGSDKRATQVACSQTRRTFHPCRNTDPAETITPLISAVVHLVSHWNLLGLKMKRSSFWLNLNDWVQFVKEERERKTSRKSGGYSSTPGTFVCQAGCTSLSGPGVKWTVWLLRSWKRPKSGCRVSSPLMSARHLQTWDLNWKVTNLFFYHFINQSMTPDLFDSKSLINYACM